MTIPEPADKENMVIVNSQKERLQGPNPFKNTEIANTEDGATEGKVMVMPGKSVKTDPATRQPQPKLKNKSILSYFKKKDKNDGKEDAASTETVSTNKKASENVIVIDEDFEELHKPAIPKKKTEALPHKAPNRVTISALQGLVTGTSAAHQPSAKQDDHKSPFDDMELAIKYNAKELPELEKITEFVYEWQVNKDDQPKLVKFKPEQIKILYGVYDAFYCFLDSFRISVNDEPCMATFEVFIKSILNGSIIHLLVKVVRPVLTRALSEVNFLSFNALLELYLKEAYEANELLEGELKDEDVSWLRKEEWIDADIEKRVRVLNLLVEDLASGEAGRKFTMKASKMIQELATEKINLQREVHNHAQLIIHLDSTSKKLDSTKRQTQFKLKSLREEQSKLVDVGGDLDRIRKIQEEVQELERVLGGFDSQKEAVDKEIQTRKANETKNKERLLEIDDLVYKSHGKLSLKENSFLGKDRHFRSYWLLKSGYIMVEPHMENEPWRIIKNKNDLTKLLNNMLNHGRRENALRKSIFARREEIERWMEKPPVPQAVKKPANKQEVIVLDSCSADGISTRSSGTPLALETESIDVHEPEYEVDGFDYSKTMFRMLSEKLSNFEWLMKEAKKIGRDKPLECDPDLVTLSSEFSLVKFPARITDAETASSLLHSALKMFSDSFYYYDYRCMLCRVLVKDLVPLSQNGRDVYEMMLPGASLSFLCLFVSHLEKHIDRFISAWEDAFELEQRNSGKNITESNDSIRSTRLREKEESSKKAKKVKPKKRQRRTVKKTDHVGYYEESDEFEEEDDDYTGSDNVRSGAISNSESSDDEEENRRVSQRSQRRKNLRRRDELARKERELAELQQALKSSREEQEDMGTRRSRRRLENEIRRAEEEKEELEKEHKSSPFDAKPIERNVRSVNLRTRVVSDSD